MIAWEEPPFGSPVILLEQHAQRVLEPLPLFDGQRCEKALLALGGCSGRAGEQAPAPNFAAETR